MTGKEIVERAMQKTGWKYWYGAKGEEATSRLASILMHQNPNVWTNEYYNKALADIKNHAIVCDCSGLVCNCYGMKNIGTSQMVPGLYGLKEKTYAAARPGMIGWKKGHCGIIIDEDMHIAEMRGIDTDFCAFRTFKECGFTKVLYMEGVDYKKEEDTYKECGWHSDAGGWWYRHTKGIGKDTYYHDSFQTVNGHTYYFDSEGYIRTPAQVEYVGTFANMRLERVSPKSETGWLV